MESFRDNPGASLAQLGRKLGVSKTTAMRLVNQLIAEGYLKREGQEVRVRKTASEE